MNTNYYAQQPQPARGQNYGQPGHNQIPEQVMQYADQDYFAGPNIPGSQYYNVVMPVAVPSASTMPHALPPLNGPPAGSPGLTYPNTLGGYPVAPPQGQPMGSHYFGSYSQVAGPSSIGWTSPPNPNPIQIPTPTPPIPHLGSPITTNPLSPIQGPMGIPFPQSLPPVTPNQIPLFPQQQPPSHNSGNAMGQPYPIPASAPPPDPRLNHNPGPAVHPMYRDLHLQALLKDPKNQQSSPLVNIRREKRVVLAIALHSDSYPISNRGWEGILLPQTRSVESAPVQQISPTKLLKLSIQVLACARGDVNAQPCNSCWSRERPPHDLTVQPYMIDFKAQSRQIALSTHLSGNNDYLKADVKFHFTCYSRHHEGLYRLILKLHDEFDNLVAYCSLPYKFFIKANGNDTGVGYCETQEHTTPPQQNLWTAFPVPNRSPVASMNFHPVPVNQHLQPNPNPPASILQRLAPAEGPVSGGPTILLSGINFPHPHQQIVYARFGAVVVPTYWHNAHTLECKLPPSPTPGTVDVTLSLYPGPGGPEFGQSHCSFRYNLEIDYIHALIRTISGQGHTLTPENWDAMIPLFVEKVSSAGRKILHEATQPMQPMNPPYSTTAGEMEALTVQLLASFTNSPNWEDSVSFVNEHHQTLAHLAVLFRYTTLLDKVAQWGINVDVQDVNGFTALHCAYLCGDLDAVRILQGYGADEDVQDSLGRRPLDMYIPRERGSPSSNPTTEDWEEVSAASSQLGSFDDCEPNPASTDRQLDAGGSNTSSGTFPVLISMPSPNYDVSPSTEVLTNRFGKFGLYDSPTEMEQRQLSPQFPDVPVVQLCPPVSEARVPAQTHQGMPTRPQESGHSSSSAPSSHPTPRLSISEAQPSSGPEATSGQEAARSDNSPSTSPSPLTTSVQMPTPSPFQHDTPGLRSPSSSDLQPAHSNSPATSCHLLSPCPGTKDGLKSQPVTRPASVDPPKQWCPPSHPPPVISGSGLASLRPSVCPNVKPPIYEFSPEKFNGDKKLALIDMIENELEGSKGGPVKLSPGKGKQPCIAPEKEGPANEKRKALDLHEGSRFSEFRPDLV